MGNFDEVRRMQAIADQMDEDPSVFEAEVKTESIPDTEQVQEEAQPVVTVEAPEEDLAGGLTESLEDGEDEPLSIDDILGLKPEDEPKEKTTPAAREATETVKTPEPSAIEARLAEMAKTNRELNEKVELLTKRALQEGIAPTANDVEGDHTDPLNPEVQEYLQPYLKAMLGFDPQEMIAENQRLKKITEPLLADAETREFGEEVAGYVDGFKPEYMPQLISEHNGMSEEDKGRYTDDFKGAVRLATSMMNRGAFNKGKPKTKVSGLAARHHSESSGPAPASTEGMNEAQKLEKLLNMDNDEFIRLTDRMDEF